MKAVFALIVVFGYSLYPWISAAGTCFPRGWMGASSAMPAGSPIPLYFPQESSAFLYNPLKVLTIFSKSNKLSEKSLNKQG
ncbi:hypothetical protein [Bacillus sp. UMB0893]|uniref:hypothetical protein n=1 Tax=Bacillus sp. UMB0893 TaxID=2066053 RepID=UPI000C784754|nr:hypothetical protein [Bacillus sp. UMB0893]PLR66095.1 hypothetical protein CYJ36_20765 [Bacillus sp. UMB0893]